MKTTKLFLLVPALILFGFTAGDPGLTKAERKAGVQYLETTREALLKSISGLSAEQLAFKPDAESWSVAECVEHLAISETNLFGMLQQTLQSAADPAKRSEVKMTDEDVFKAISDRTQKVKTREGFVPSGKFGSHEATVKEFTSKRDQTISYVKNTPDDLRNHFFTFPFGTLDSYQILVFIASHTKRHTLQIEEIKSNPAFPKK